MKEGEGVSYQDFWNKILLMIFFVGAAHGGMTKGQLP